MSVCNTCNNQFEITDRDRTFYARMDVPEPKRCPRCRLQHCFTMRIEIVGKT